MRVPILVPDVKVEGRALRVSSWFVAVGESIAVGDRVAEILIPGVTFDISAESEGTLCKIDQHVGAEVHAGDTLGWIETDASSPVDESPDET